MNPYTQPGNPDEMGYPPALDGTTDEEWWELQNSDEKWIAEEEQKNELF